MTLCPKSEHGDKVPPAAYQTFCRLGEAVTFVNGNAADPQLTNRIDAAVSVMEKIAGRLKLFWRTGPDGCRTD